MGNPIRGAAQAARNHPVYSVLAVFAIGGTVAAIINNRRSQKFDDVELPGTEVREADLVDHDALKDATGDSDKGDIEGGGDSISREIRP